MSTFATEAAKDAFLAIRDFEKQFGHRGMVPVTVVIGFESAGKSSWISARVGFPVSYVKRGVGTRCPVRYRLKHDRSKNEPTVTVNGKNVDKRSLRDSLKKQMDTLGESFSDVMVDVEISSAAVQDMEIIDLPGLRPGAPAAEEQQLRQISAKYMRPKYAHIVAILKCTDAIATMTDKNYLHAVATDANLTDIAPRPFWRKSTIFLINHFNKESTHWDMSRVNEFFREAAAEPFASRQFFVVLMPNPSIDTAKAPIEKLESIYGNMVQDEKTWWSEFIARKYSESHVPWDNSHNDLIGLDKANAAVDVIWEHAFRKDVPLLLVDARNKKEALEQKKLQLKRTLDSMTALPQLATDFITDFHSHFKAFVENRHVQDVDNAAHRMPHEHIYAVETFGHTYQQELQLSPVDKKTCPWLMTRAELSPLLGENSSLQEDLDLKMMGKAAVDRSTTILTFATLTSGFRNADKQTMANLARTNKPNGDVQTSEIVSQIAKSQIMRLTNSMEWFTKHLKTMFNSYATPVLNVLLDSRSRYAVFRGSLLERDLRDLLSNLLERQVQAVAEQYAYDAKRTSRFSVLDPIGQSLMLTTMIQMDEVVAKLDHILPPSVVPESADREDLVDLDTQGAYFPLTSYRKQHDPAPRLIKKHKLLRNLAIATRHHQKTFNVEDFVSNGVVHLSLTDMTMMDTHYINNVAYICFLHIVLHLMRNLRSTIDLEFLDYIGDSRDQKMLKDLMKINRTEAYLASSVSVTPDELKSSYDKAQLEEASLHVIIHKLEGLRSRLDSNAAIEDTLEGEHMPDDRQHAQGLEGEKVSDTMGNEEEGDIVEPARAGVDDKDGSEADSNDF